MKEKSRARSEMIKPKAYGTLCGYKDSFVIATWRPGETVWSIYRVRNESSSGIWEKCVYSHGVSYIFSNCGHVVFFDPCSSTWDLLPVNRCD
ncbi:hypothetical protein Bca4012_061423 [Brassica carinata]|uniref:Uncharacterized protein n=1 Tax=Brassica carinata TaxID=52824 RepID=A0A8X7SAL6_BRACI|nr:hypothetical protein Bca52824_031731 [Brassica carinata]